MQPNALLGRLFRHSALFSICKNALYHIKKSEQSKMLPEYSDCLFWQGRGV